MMTAGSPPARASRKTKRSWCGARDRPAPRSEAMAREATVQCAARQSERLRGAAHVAVVTCQGLLNEHLLNVFEREVLEPRRGARSGAKSEIGGAHLVPRREQHGALHDVIELADVA